LEFTLTDTVIKSNWFDEGNNTCLYKQIKKEKGLNLYLQLFKFRVHKIHKGNRDDYKMYNHIFRVCLYDLRESMSVNTSKKPSYDKVIEMLELLINKGVIKFNPFHKKDSFESAIKDGEGNYQEFRLLELEAIDIPKFNGVDEKGNHIVGGKENNFIPVEFGVIDYILNELKLSTFHVAVYLYIMKWSRLQKKSFKSINNMATELGVRNRRVKKVLLDLNRGGVIYTVRKVSKKNRDNPDFEHYPCEKFKSLEGFIKETKEARDKFIKHHGEDWVEPKKKKESTTEENTQEQEHVNEESETTDDFEENLNPSATTDSEESGEWGSEPRDGGKEKTLDDVEEEEMLREQEAM